MEITCSDFLLHYDVGIQLFPSQWMKTAKDIIKQYCDQMRENSKHEC